MARGAQEGGTRTYRATVAYDGTVYSGFQIQPERPTIQGELERALQRLTQQFVRIDGAGRTDTGVHAHGQVISFKARWSHGVETLQRAMNAVLPRDIAVRDVAEADERFHARFSARGRTYVYSIYQSEVRSPLLDRFAHHVTTPLYVDRMAQAGDKLIGEHDYAAFGQPPFGENTVRTVYRAEWRWQNAARGVGAMVELPPLLQFEIEANAFLRGMVRRLVGTLLQVGSGTLTVDDFVDILASQEIARAGVPAPACGLCLWHVRYAKQEECGCLAVSCEPGGETLRGDSLNSGSYEMLHRHGWKELARVKTYSIKASEIEREWFVVDAQGQNLGRLATRIATILRGKHKPTFTPGMDVGDFVIVVNADKITVTGNKMQEKMYYRHSLYPGGLRETSLESMLAKHPERVVEHAVRGMLPKNRLGRAMMKKLKVYAGGNHPHQAQKPRALEL